MANKSPIFPMPQPHHFSDYGFDPQINYFQFLEEARKHKRDTPSFKPIDSLHFKLQKPISKDESGRKTHKKKRWWKKAFVFIKRKWVQTRIEDEEDEDVHRARAKAFRGSISGPVYITESRSGSSTPYRTNSGPVAGNLTSASKGDLGIPYLSLRQLNMEQQEQRLSTSNAMPIYLVT
ncbi:hypothetical protein M5689_005485 [Euphorbia peplus]|nr:hypothetical protein M5689_005485 [Euphorbia peplus]